MVHQGEEDIWVRGEHQTDPQWSVEEGVGEDTVGLRDFAKIVNGSVSKFFFGLDLH